MKYFIFPLITMLSLSAFAQSRYEKRMQRQQERIEQGVQSGQLSEKEAQTLQKQEAHIQKVEQKLEADGSLSGQDKAKLERMQDRESKRIFRKKHNKRQR